MSEDFNDDELAQDAIEDEVIDDEGVDDETERADDSNTDADSMDYSLEELENFSKSQGKPSKDNVVPQSRFNAVNAKAKELEQANRDLSDRLEQASASRKSTSEELSLEIKELQKKAKEAFIDNEEELYDELQEKIIDNIRRQAALDTQDLINQDASRRAIELDKRLIEDVLEDWRGEYPEINPESEDFNADLWDDVVTFQAALVSKGNVSGYVAAEKALKKLVGALSEPKPTIRAGLDERTKRSLERGLEKERNPVPNITRNSVGGRSVDSSIDWENISQEEYDKLPQDVIDKQKGKK